MFDHLTYLYAATVHDLDQGARRDSNGRLTEFVEITRVPRDQAIRLDLCLAKQTTLYASPHPNLNEAARRDDEGKITDFAELTPLGNVDEHRFASPIHRLRSHVDSFVDHNQLASLASRRFNSAIQALFDKAS